MPDVAFAWLDVFTDTPFSGNPLAVVPDAAELSDDQMQRIAGELNLSETVFVAPASTPEALRSVRIFTPSIELPYAGHPTIGAAVLLAELGVAAPGSSFVLEEGAGPVHVHVSGETAGPGSATLTSPQPLTMFDAPDAADAARLVGLAPADLDTELDVAVASVGLPFLLVPVASQEALRRSRLDRDAWPTLLAGRPGEHVYVFTPPRNGHIAARMFAPAMGIVEDPATGAAASALAGYLGRRLGVAGSWTIRQGEGVGRPSQLHIDVDVRDREVIAVRVGGYAVRVAEGVLHVPD